MEATDTIVVATVVVAGSTLIRDVHEGKRRAAPIIFGFLMAIGLLVIAIPAPKTAKALSYFAMVGALVVNGKAVFDIVSGVTSGKEATAFKLPPSPPHDVRGPIGLTGALA